MSEPSLQQVLDRCPDPYHDEYYGEMHREGVQVAQVEASHVTCCVCEKHLKHGSWQFRIRYGVNYSPDDFLWLWACIDPETCDYRAAVKT